MLEPMQLKTALIAAIAFALTGAVWVLSQRAAPSAPAVANTRTAAVRNDPERVALQASLQAQTFRERQDFEARAKRFLQQASSLGDVERSEQARALTASIDRYEREGGLSAGEALLLRSGLIKATVADEQEQALQIADVMQRYRSDAERRMAQHLAQQQRDPNFQDYKTRERAIVAEVMALREIPGGLSRDEYLRQRLQQAREAAYGQ
jgi:aspartate carbamoyltransferase catalytic subunit